MEDFKPMSCHGLHHACECKEELLRDAIDSLSEILAGLEKYRKTLSLKQQVVFRAHTYGLKMAESVLVRARKI
jgi:hypothetical protein